MAHAAKFVHKNPLLDNLKAKTPPKEKSKDNKVIQVVEKTGSVIDVYEEETRKLRYHISDYYLFAKHKNQLSLPYRVFSWEALALFSGFICFIIPFYSYGYGVANSSGRTEDLFTAAIAVYQANVLTHHMQMYVTIRNFSTWFAFTSVTALLFLWPMMMLVSQYSEEHLAYHLGTVIFDQFFLQISSVVLATACVTIILYAFKMVKMRILYPQFFPTKQSIGCNEKL